jgi:hypothetical protein
MKRNESAASARAKTSRFADSREQVSTFVLDELVLHLLQKTKQGKGSLVHVRELYVVGNLLYRVFGLESNADH